jgi:hypothetical protein
MAEKEELIKKVESDQAKIRRLEQRDFKTIYKATLVICSLTLITINCRYGFALPSTDVKCMHDSSHEMTAHLNAYFLQNAWHRNILLIFSSFCIDLAMLSIGIFWVFRVKSWRFIITMIVFYGFRGFLQGFFQMGYPEGYFWENPGFSSLFVSYLKTNDFFYSGHVGLPIIVACEFAKHKKYWLSLFAFCTCFLEFFVMIVMRGHYFIDLVTGVLLAHYFWIIVDKYIYLLDNSFLSLEDLLPNAIEDETKEKKTTTIESEINNCSGSETDFKPLNKACKKCKRFQ